MSPTRIKTPEPALVIDGSSTCFFAGVLGNDGKWLASRTATEPALESLFKTVDAVLDEACIDLEQIQAYIYCEGPGSVLGLRLCSMAIETWRRLQPNPPKVYAYNSLSLTVAGLLDQITTAEAGLLVSDWKKDTWNSMQIHRDAINVNVSPISSEELTDWQGPIYHLPARKGWQRPPEGAIELSYAPKQLAKLLSTPGLVRETGRVELYQSGINTFRKWTPERHRAISV